MDSSDVQMDRVEEECFFLLELDAATADGGAGWTVWVPADRVELDGWW